MMKRIMCMFLAVLMLLGLTACGTEKQKQEAAPAEAGFKPALDSSSSCHISVAGGYSNFEALEAEFDRFNEYYPNVDLTFTKVDDYNNMIGMVLNGNDAPDIYVNYSWMYGREQYQDSIDHAENLSDLYPQQHDSEHRRRYAPDGPGFLEHLRHAREQRSV